MPNASTNDSGLPSPSRCNCVRSNLHVPLSSRRMGRSTLSISVTTRPPYFGAFYVFPERVVNPVTIETQHLEDGDPYRTHMRRPRHRFGSCFRRPQYTTSVGEDDACGAMPEVELTKQRFRQRLDATRASGTCRWRPIVRRHISASGRVPLGLIPFPFVGPNTGFVAQLVEARKRRERWSQSTACLTGILLASGASPLAREAPLAP